MARASWASAAVLVLAVCAMNLEARAAPSGIHPIIYLGKDYSYFVGGTLDGRWLEPENLVASLRGGENYRLYSLTAALGTATGSMPTEEEQGPAYTLEVAPRPSGGQAVIGVCGDWDALPRTVHLQNVHQKVYEDAARAFLAGKGMRNVKISFSHILRGDFDGDGEDEVLLSATTPNYGQYTGAPREFSFAALRDVVGGKVRTYLVDGEFWSHARRPHEYRGRYWVGAALDLDGDGVQEIVLRHEAAGGTATNAYALRGDKVVRLCGGGFGT